MWDERHLHYYRVLLTRAHVGPPELDVVIWTCGNITLLCGMMQQLVCMSFLFLATIHAMICSKLNHPNYCMYTLHWRGFLLALKYTATVWLWRGLDPCGYDSSTNTVLSFPPPVINSISIVGIFRWMPFTMPTPKQELILSLRPEFVWLSNKQRSGSRGLVSSVHHHHLTVTNTVHSVSTVYLYSTIFYSVYLIVKCRPRSVCEI